MEEGELIEIFGDTPLEECARRGPKRKALAGKIANSTRVSSPYEILGALSYISKRLATTLRSWRLRSNSSSKGEWSKYA
ncbi:Adenylylsulphate kinase [Rhizobium aethiopicum]|uniref:Adenylylsulphate kinase n=1 Tax=Rhizobium aethiopicum TaxID=1138170 RepID=A0A1C3YCC0_9HYPH|nr:Adenylylsulphate kinase [Rhizobium aethiopicum]